MLDAVHQRVTFESPAQASVFAKECLGQELQESQVTDEPALQEFGMQRQQVSI